MLFLFVYFSHKQSAQSIAPNTALLVQTSHSESSLSTLADRVDGTEIKKSQSHFDLPMETTSNLELYGTTDDEDFSDYNKEAQIIEEVLKKKIVKERKKREEKGIRTRSKKGTRKVHIDE